MRGRKDGSGEPLNNLVSVDTHSIKSTQVHSVKCNTILYKNTNMPCNSAITDTKNNSIPRTSVKIIKQSVSKYT